MLSPPATPQRLPAELLVAHDEEEDSLNPVLVSLAIKLCCVSDEGAVAGAEGDVGGRIIVAVLGGVEAVVAAVAAEAEEAAAPSTAPSLERLPTRGKLTGSFPSPDVAPLTASSPLPCSPPSGDAAAAEGGVDELAVPLIVKLPPVMTDDARCRRHVQSGLP